MRILIWIISLVAMGYAGYIVWQPLELDVDRVEENQSISRPLVMRNASFNNFKNGQKDWALTANIAKIYHQEEVTILYAVRGTLYDPKDPKKMSKLVAKQGHISGQEKLVSMKGDVKLSLDNGDQLLSEKLTLDQKKGVIYTDVKLKFIHQKDKINADGLVYDIHSKKLVLKNPILEMITL